MVILICDDSKVIQLILRTILEQLGHEVVVTDSVASGQARLQQGGIECALLDLHLDDGSGFEVLETACEQQVPAIIISSDSDHRQRERARTMGACHYLNKPFTADKLRDLLHGTADSG